MKVKTIISKAKELVKKVKLSIIDSVGFIKSCFIIVFHPISKPGIFTGYLSFWFAKKYADKRTKKWKDKWDQSGKKQGVLPLTDTSLIVCSASELKYFKKRKLINGKINPRKAIRKSYYKTEII